MNSARILIIAFTVMFLASLVLSYAFGIGLFSSVWRILLPALIIAIHLICSGALFRETKTRMERGIKIFADLDPFFWALVGVVFGVLGLLSYRLLNDHFTVSANQPDQDR